MHLAPPTPTHQRSDMTLQSRLPDSLATLAESEQDAANRLEALARELAITQTVEPLRGQTTAARPTLLDPLPKLAARLRAAHRYFVNASEEELALAYASEWLLDNFHVIEQALRQLKQDLPVGYYRQLPKLRTDDAMQGLPRVYALARTLIIHDEYQVDTGRLEQFVIAYQQHGPLTMGELWAMPIMLRLVLLECIAQAAGNITGVTGDLSTPAYPLTLSHNDIIANCIPSLRLIDNENWEEFFERVSLVQQILLEDPSGVYAHMDFPTRNDYRRVIETMARATHHTEPAIAQQAVDLAQAAYDAEPDKHSPKPKLVDKPTWDDQSAAAESAADSSWCNFALSRNAHIGYYLLAEGRAELDSQVGYQPDTGERLRRWVLAHPTLVYLSGVGLFTLLIELGAIAHALSANASTLATIVTALLVLIPALTTAIHLVNWLVTHTLPPRVLPKLDLEEGIPSECRTMVVVPALLGNADDVESLFTQLELHYLRNPDLRLTFALLSDFTDAQQAELPEDAALLDQARAAVAALNQKYAHQPFYFFHRRRLWNQSEGRWMGWERKRGKLHEFNQLLRNDQATSFFVQAGKLDLLPAVRYVITLDADTVLPRDAAQRLVGTLSHPLNQARFAPGSNRVRAGYTILQPRTAIKPVSANQSLFTRIFAGEGGLDLYTLAVSDAYQDLFGAGIFVGKGIYDVDAFERSLIGRIPENTLLSHDLFEGVHGRVGLVSDIVLYEEYPPHYLVNVLRSHRWIRGDWQLLPWLWGRTPRVGKETGSGGVGEGGRGGERETTPAIFYARNDLALIDRWKIIDNLHRSLLPPTLLMLFVLGWTVLPGSPWVWTLLGLIVPLFSLLTRAISGLLRALIGEEGLAAAGREIIRPIRDSGVRWLLFLAFLPYEALLNLDAITTTLTRVWVTRRQMLQWTTAERTVRLFGDEVTATTTLVKMLPSILLTVGLALLVIILEPMALFVAAPFFVAWLFAWQIAYWISRPTTPKAVELSAERQQMLRILARRTWLFYELFVGPDDNWLPPDHFQESPRGVVAHRTSPTNVGMYLLSLLAAHDFGFITTTNVSLRIQFAFASLNRQERYRGHFLNWIDTRTLDALPPRYVSTVDSGNLAACLIALRQGLLTLPQQTVWRWEQWQGLLDMFALLTEAIADTDEGSDPTANNLCDYLAEMRRQVLAVRKQPEAWYAALLAITEVGRQELDRRLVDYIEANVAHLNAERLRDARIYVERIHYRMDNMRREAETLLPWLPLYKTTPALFDSPATPEALREAWRALYAVFPIAPSFEQLAGIYTDAEQKLNQIQALMAELPPSETLQAAHQWCATFADALSAAPNAATTLLSDLAAAADQADAYVNEMEFNFLFDAHRQVFHIGYNLDNGRLDANYYDLLASEARIASLVAIAKGDVPQSHWLHLSRPLTRTENGQEVLLSWSGTMFEYLMPPLLMRTYPTTLLYQSAYATIDHQVAYGKRRNIPWGISESGFYSFDAALNYQYHAFGVPGLGFQRGLGNDLVITPYASLLALPLQPEPVLQNLDLLKAQGVIGRYGLYEAVDFTPERLGLGEDKAIVRSYMAHHQGMIMLALAATLQGNRMVERFHADPRIQSVELLLQEQIPQDAPLQFPHEEENAPMRAAQPPLATHGWQAPMDTPLPLVHFLSNGRYGTLITNSGAGFSQWEGLALTRWRADTTLDDWGCWLYVQEPATRALWSLGRQPIHRRGDFEEVIYHPHMAEFRRRDAEIALNMQLTIAPEDDVEIRRIDLTNNSDEVRTLRLTTYGEPVLAPPAGDARHQAFAKLFVESEYVADINTLLFRRRPRSEDEKPKVLAHLLVMAQGKATGAHESDRARFLGRGHTNRYPALLINGEELSGTTGATLDPIMALGQDVTLEPHAGVQLAVITLTANSRQEAINLARRYQAWATIERAFHRSRIAAEQELRQLGLNSPALESIGQLLSLLLYPHPAHRADAATLAANRKGQAAMWAFGISGDYPILLLRLRDEADGELLQELLQAHSYWRRRDLKIDLVIMNQQESNYGQPVQGFINRLIRRTDGDAWLNQRGGIFVLREDQMVEADRILLYSAARVILDGENGLLHLQLAELLRQPVALPPFAPTVSPDEIERQVIKPTVTPRPTDLRFDNGLGGFSADGREYVIYLEPNTPTNATPAPWINVIANDRFGFLVSEAGSGYTWADNSGENRLTTWRNDPVGDQSGEALYLRDEESGEIWSPTPQPTPATAPYIVRHGAGYTTFEHASHGLTHHLRLFIAPDAPVKIVQLRLENQTSRPRRITATYYAEWVLGVDHAATQPFLVPEYTAEGRALLVRNPYNAEFGEAVAFLAANKEPHGLTGDRTEFLGRLGSLRRPVALGRVGLSGRVEAGLDPCAAMQLHIDLPPGGSETIYFLIGQEADRAAALSLIQQFQQAETVEAAWQATHARWDEMLGAVQVETPDPAMNLLLNRWLLYQTLACRIWGRSALYQSSGAFGFRDQLQDVMAVVHTRPDLARAHILRAAQHQFDAGDVLHWWHPPVGRGVRTRFSDDLLWLPYVTAYYVAATGDATILEEQVPFLRGDPLRPDEEERYAQYESTPTTFSIFEHCRRALEKGTTAGQHGIPLMGAGDWNDGMSRVGIHGQGESIWMGWFLCATLTSFADLCERDGKAGQARLYREQAEHIRIAVEENGWDGDWYRRAYYDDGTPLGSAQNRECQIDSIAQSWGILARAADPERARRAMQAVLDRLVKWDARLILLFTPPFDKTNKDPGYIKGYLPGIRENGGQYTHAALWTIWAFARTGDGTLAEQLFRLINPIYRADSAEKAALYKVEPYVISADVYGVAPHVGRGGWTWYTGSSGWMYRLGIEAMLGLQRVGPALRIDPCIPAIWPRYSMRYRNGQSYYYIQVENPNGISYGVKQVTVDGVVMADGLVPLQSDGGEHTVVVTMG